MALKLFNRVMRLFAQAAAQPMAVGKDAVLRPAAFQAMVTREKARATCNGHGFTLLTLSLPTKQKASALAATLRQQVRNSDEVGWEAEGRLSIFLYNTSKTEVPAFMQKIMKNLGPEDRQVLKYAAVQSYPDNLGKDC